MALQMGRARFGGCIPKPFFFLALIFAFPCITSANTPERDASLDTVELHAHLFMKRGMGWLFRGDFEEPLRADSWDDRFSSQANADAVNRSGIGVLVASLYAHPLLKWSLKDSIRAQIAQARQFVSENPQWILAKSSAEALAGRKLGKRILILSLESSAGILETEEDLKEFVDEGGIRIVTLLHLTDDHLGGAAFLQGLLVLASPIAFFQSLLSPSYDGDARLNNRGLTASGLDLAQRLIARKVWIDLAHSSDASQRDLVPLLRKKEQPLLYTHTTLRRHYPAERGLAQRQLLAVQDSQGVIGLMPSEMMLEFTAINPLYCPASCSPCRGGVAALATQYSEAAAAIGSQAIALGSDFNGGVDHIAPKCGAYDLGPKGFYEIGQTPALWKALRNSGAPLPTKTGSAAEYFLATWARVDG